MSETTQTSQSLYQALWNSADVLRSKMDANDYKSYLLGMVFYKYLSDKMLFFVAETMEEETESLEEALAVYRKYYEDEEPSSRKSIRKPNRPLRPSHSPDAPSTGGFHPESWRYARYADVSYFR